MNVPARLRRITASRAAAPVVTAALTAIGAVLATWPLARNMGQVTLRSGEVLLTAWQLNWYHQALLTDPRSWADANIFFPYDRTAAFNDLLMTHALITLPAAWAESPVLSLNLAFLGGIVLCGLCAYLLIVELADEPWAGAVGGVLFALAPFRFLHVGHLSIAAAWPIPLFFWALLRQLRAPSWARAAVVALTGLLLGLSSLYHAAYVAPLVPLVLLAGARRGPGGRRVWLPLVAAGLPALALLVWFLIPFASALGSYGVAAASDDLLRYGADFSSLGQKPQFLDETAAASNINPEAQLYPGAGLAWLAVGGLVAVLASIRTLRGRNRGAAVATVVFTGAVVLGFVVPLPAPVRDLWRASVLALIWAGPIALMGWAILGAKGVGHAVALRLGLAGAAIAFVFALGPEARHLGRQIGPAPYWLLTQVSAAFEGTRVPARFGGLVLLFLAVLAGGALAMLFRSHRRGLRMAGAGAAAAAILACAAELPVPPLPEGHNLEALPGLRDPVYQWLADHPGRISILELPDWPPDAGVPYRQREWRALRHMLASKQHGQALVNGTGRIEPFLWQRFRWLEHWSDEFFTYIAAYFPVDYVLVHDEGVSPAARGPLFARLESGRDGWRQMFRSAGVRIYRVDRSFGRGRIIDRLMLRRDIAPRADVRFAARMVVDPTRPAAETDGAAPVLELLRDDGVIVAHPLGADWREFQATVTVDERADDRRTGWPRTATLLRWQLRAAGEARFEIKGITVVRSGNTHE